MLTLSRFVCPSTSNSTKSPLPTNVVAVTTPAILTLSKFVCPSTSISPLTSKVTTVVTPVTLKDVAVDDTETKLPIL